MCVVECSEINLYGLENHRRTGIYIQVGVSQEDVY